VCARKLLEMKLETVVSVWFGFTGDVHCHSKGWICGTLQMAITKSGAVSFTALVITDVQLLANL